MKKLLLILFTLLIATDFAYSQLAIRHAVGLRLDARLRKQLYLTGTFMNYTRDTKYKYYDNVFSNTSEGRIMLTYKH